MKKEQQVITRHWNDRADSYDFNISKNLFSKKCSERWKSIIAEVTGDKDSCTILDAGCGPAVLTRILVSLGHQVTAIDVSEKMLAHARNYMGENPRVKFLRCSATRLPFPDNSFDMVLSRYVIWTLPNPVDALREWKRVVKPGGLIGVIDGNWYYHYYRSGLVRNISHLKNFYYRLRSGFKQGQKLADSYASDLPCTQVLRPHWDIGVLDGLEMKDIRVQENLEKRLATFPSLTLPQPFRSGRFLITARKPQQQNQLPMS